MDEDGAAPSPVTSPGLPEHMKADGVGRSRPTTGTAPPSQYDCRYCAAYSARLPVLRRLLSTTADTAPPTRDGTGPRGEPAVDRGRACCTLGASLIHRGRACYTGGEPAVYRGRACCTQGASLLYTGGEPAVHRGKRAVDRGRACCTQGRACCTQGASLL
jgi:hypothetical protein